MKIPYSLVVLSLVGSLVVVSRGTFADSTPSPSKTDSVKSAEQDFPEESEKDMVDGWKDGVDYEDDLGDWNDEEPELEIPGQDNAEPSQDDSRVRPHGPNANYPRGDHQLKFVVTVGKPYEWRKCRMTAYLDGKVIVGLKDVTCTQGAHLKSELHPGYVGPTPVGTRPALKYGSASSSSMKYAVYFKEYYAIHRGKLSSGSHGCVRVSEATALRVWNLTHKYGLANTTISLVRG